MTAFSTTTKAYILFQKELWQYNPETNKWLSKADFPGDAISWQSSFSIGDKGYVGTGTTPEGNYTGEFYEYDEASDEWHVLNSMPRGGTQGIGFAVDEKGYLGLGTHGSLYEYSTGVNEWQFKTNYPTNSYWVNRSDLVASTGNGKVYMGSGNYYGSLTEFYEFDPAQNKITRLSDAPGPGRMNAFSFFLEGKLYVGGGQAYMGGPVYGDFYEYDPLKEEF
jgi:N-acetylneuraminic acid mutarotase